MNKQERSLFVLGILIGLILMMSVMIILSFVSAAPNSIINTKIAPPEVHLPESTTVLTSTSGGGCITPEWIFNGKKWVGRDLVSIHGKIYRGCAVLDMETHRLIPVPQYTPLHYDNYYSPIFDGWWNANSMKSYIQMKGGK